MSKRAAAVRFVVLLSILVLVAIAIDALLQLVFR